MVKEDMAEVEVTEEDIEGNWRWKIRCGDPLMGKSRKRKKKMKIYRGEGIEEDLREDDWKKKRLYFCCIIHF